MANVYKIGSNILRSAGGGGIWRPPVGGGGSTGFTFDSGFSGTGDFTNGQLVTVDRIAGGFGTKVLGAGPKLFYDFNNSLSPDALSRDPSSDTGLETNIVRDTTVAPANQTSTMRKIWTYGSPNGSPAGTDGAIWPAGVTCVPDYLYIWARMYQSMSATEAEAARQALNGDNANVKGWRIWKDIGGPTATDFVRTYHGNVADWNPGMSAENLNLGEADLAYNPPDTSQAVNKQEWHVDEFLLKQSTDENTTNGYWYAGIKGKIKPGNAAWDFSAIATSTASRPGKQTLLFGEQIERSGYILANNQYTAYAQIYVDEDPKRIVVSDKASWSIASTHTVHEIQIDTDWSDTSIGLALRQGVASLPGNYMYFVNGVAGTRIGRFNP